ncbi:SGNH/GDSL hydrolase family protein [Vibrio rarus]|uniref:SGNH/GDSL hydrolase family protein n=1 Tax=Vibrio rarus TaxID=413403 RepID=UPI0021C2B3A4|nr:SGNH/GDSL hydrolase family protein [Vibrio rarus]
MKHTINEKAAQYQPNQIVLLGDSIFDNAPYVQSGESVSEQLETLIGKPHNTSCTTQVDLLAVDGHVMAHIPGQLEKVQPKDQFAKQYAFVSCGGNDLLGYTASGLLLAQAKTVADALESMDQAREYFRQGYTKMLDELQSKFECLTVCTIYDSIPNLPDSERVALCLFNEVILREAANRKLPVLDLRFICNQQLDYAPVSPIEPSKYGAKKIAQAIWERCDESNDLGRGISS